VAGTPYHTVVLIRGSLPRDYCRAASAAQSGPKSGSPTRALSFVNYASAWAGGIEEAKSVDNPLQNLSLNRTSTLTIKKTPFPLRVQEFLLLLQVQSEVFLL